jgi:hypothetical protein
MTVDGFIIEGQMRQRHGNQLLEIVIGLITGIRGLVKEIVSEISKPFT